MGFNRQLDALVVILATLITFVSCIFWFGIPVEISFLITACVFLGGLLFGRRFAEVVTSIFS